MHGWMWRVWRRWSICFSCLSSSVSVAVVVVLVGVATGCSSEVQWMEEVVGDRMDGVRPDGVEARESRQSTELSSVSVSGCG